MRTDRATEFLLNGMAAQFSDLKVGDKIGTDLPFSFKADEVWNHFVRIYRF